MVVGGKRRQQTKGDNKQAVAASVSSTLAVTGKKRWQQVSCSSNLEVAASKGWQQTIDGSKQVMAASMF